MNTEVDVCVHVRAPPYLMSYSLDITSLHSVCMHVCRYICTFKYFLVHVYMCIVVYTIYTHLCTPYTHICVHHMHTFVNTIYTHLPARNSLHGVCIHIHIYVGIFVYLHILYTNIYAHIPARTRRYICIFAYIVYKHLRTYTCTCAARSRGPLPANSACSAKSGRVIPIYI